MQLNGPQHEPLRFFVAICIAVRYSLNMIISFRHKGLELFYKTGSTKGIRADHAKKLNRILDRLDIAETPDDLRIPAFRLHPLRGDLKGFWSISVSGNWRVIFQFDGSNVELVDYLDYH